MRKTPEKTLKRAFHLEHVPRTNELTARLRNLKEILSLAPRSLFNLLRYFISMTVLKSNSIAAGF